MDEELVQLPWDYVPEKRGALLLATLDGEPAGMVALREFSPVACELRRLFVRAPLRTGGMGRRLFERAIKQARALGNTYLLLNTLPSMEHALKLYQAAGFYPIEPYDDKPHEGVLYFCLDLK